MTVLLSEAVGVGGSGHPGDSRVDAVLNGSELVAAGLFGGVGDRLLVGTERLVPTALPVERRPRDPGEAAKGEPAARLDARTGDLPAGVPVAAGEPGVALVGVHRSSRWSWWVAGQMGAEE